MRNILLTPDQARKVKAILDVWRFSTDSGVEDGILYIKPIKLQWSNAAMTLTVTEDKKEE